MSDNDLVQNAINGYITDVAGISNPKNAANQLVKRRKVVTLVTDGGTAGNAAGEAAFFRADVPVNVISVTYCGGVAIAANGTNLATFLVQKRPKSAPATPQTVATNTTNTTDPVFGANYVAWTPLAMTNSAPANLAMAAGDILTAQVSKSGTGVAIGAAATAAGASAAFTVVYEEA